MAEVIQQKVENVLQLTPKQLAAIKILPPGTILPWFRAKATTPPPGWDICDGTNGTPNLLGRFLVGSAVASAGETGGTATISMDGAHTHTVQQYNFNIGSNASRPWGLKEDTTSINGDHNHGGENRPPYFGVVFIMRRNER